VLPGRLQLIGFADLGEIRYAHDPWFGSQVGITYSGYTLAGANANQLAAFEARIA
jgi:hypothetical protein